ncbi:hypothetical protein Tco_1482859 [Tanacetum coccineum]
MPCSCDRRGMWDRRENVIIALVQTNMAPMALSDSEFNLANYKRGLASVKEQLVFYRKNEVIFGDKIVVLKRGVSFKDSDISWLKSELEKPSAVLLQIDLSNSGLEEFQEPKFEGYGPKTSKSASEDISNEVRKSNDALLVEKSGPISLNTARQSHFNAVRTNRVNAVKASACWVWRPIKPNSASITLKRYDYVDGNPETELEDSVRLNSPEDKKRAGAELTQENDKSQYKKCLDTSS